ncbi:MAG TPA: hypothetical protein VIK35_13210 [Verrucomicrobiae bacterium]
MKGAGSFRGGETPALDGASGKTGEPFDHLMACAMSPSSKEVDPVEEQNPPAKTIVSDSEERNVPPDKSPHPFQTRNKIAENSNPHQTEDVQLPLQSPPKKSGAQTSGKNSHKKADGNSNVAVNSFEHPELTDMAINLKNVSVATISPVVAMIDPKIGSNAKEAANISAAIPKATVAGKSAVILAALPDGKNILPAASKVPGPIISQNQTASVEANPAIKAAGQEKIAAAVEALSTEKSEPTNAKITGLTAANPQVLPSAKDAAGDLPTPKPGTESFQPPPREFSTPPGMAVKTAAYAKPDINGTPVAQQNVPMNKTENKDKTTSSAGKILPGSPVSVERENNLPPRENSSALALLRAGQMTATITGNSPDRADVARLSADPAGSIVSAAAVDFRSRTLKRTQDMIVLQTTRLINAGSGSLQVVVKPDAGTQLSLELRQHGDSVEAQAILQRGNFEHLNQQWPALQQQLEQRGIRLAPLVGDGNFVNRDGTNTFQNKQNHAAEPDSFPTGAFAEVAPVSSSAQPAARAGMHRGWESWA